MIVRELKSSAVRAICPDHFFGRRALPHGSPLLGEVIDAHTYPNECEFCAAELCGNRWEDKIVAALIAARPNASVTVVRGRP